MICTYLVRLSTAMQIAQECNPKDLGVCQCYLHSWRVDTQTDLYQDFKYFIALFP